MANAHLRNCYWGEGFLTLVYLIDQLPIKVLNNLFPHFVPYKTMSTYSNLRVFCCECYPFLRPYENNKLAFRSKQCVFTGYPSQQKGYHCLDLDTDWVFVTRRGFWWLNPLPLPQVSSCQVWLPYQFSSLLLLMCKGLVMIKFKNVYTMNQTHHMLKATQWSNHTSLCLFLIQRYLPHHMPSKLIQLKSLLILNIYPL